MKNKLTIVFMFFSFLITSAQTDGYWDKERATTKEVVLSARKKTIITTDDLPPGTTELVVRITLLGETQQMANNLVSLLKSIPDPTGISQGSAGAIFLLSKFSGEDQCVYQIFSSEIDAKKWSENRNVQACFVQNDPINKDVKRFVLEQWNCNKKSSNKFWFAFESKNWVMNQKVVLEVVPWVNLKKASGWTPENKKKIISLANKIQIQNIDKTDDFYACLLEKLQAKTSFSDFEKYLVVEQNKFIKDAALSCANDLGLVQKYFDNLRKSIDFQIQNQNFALALQSLQTIFSENQMKIEDYNRKAFALLCTKQFQKAQQTLLEAEKLDAADLNIQLLLAHTYLLNDQFDLAKEIHSKYKNQNLNEYLSWTKKANQDLELFEKLNISNNDFSKIKKILNKD